jgi:hypothetical protein
MILEGESSGEIPETRLRDWLPGRCGLFLDPALRTGLGCWLPQRLPEVIARSQKVIGFSKSGAPSKERCRAEAVISPPSGDKSKSRKCTSTMRSGVAGLRPHSIFEDLKI